MTIRTWVCRICGDPYVGEDKPTECPFCGANSKYIVHGEEYEEPVIKSLTDISRDNVLEAIKLEVDNSQFYFCASKKATTMELKKRFKALGKVEAEHAALLAKIVHAQKPVIDRDAGKCSGDGKAFVKEAHDREQRAIEHYRKFLGEATELRVKQVFAALVEIETTHIELADNTKL